MKQVSFRTRRRVSMLITMVAIAVVAGLAWLQEGRLEHSSYFTGTTLMVSLVVLVLLGVRRRLPVLRLGPVGVWTQVHLYTGIFSIAVFVMHVPAVIGSGVFEQSLSIAFLMTAASGVYGIYASRTLPKRLTAVEGQDRFDRVRWRRGQIAAKAAELLDELTEQTGTRVLGSYYRSELSPFFRSHPTLAYVVAPTGARRRRLLGGLKELDRYLEHEGRRAAGRLAALVRRRDDLDYQFALQLRLRLWLVLHCLLSVALLGGAIVHASVAWRFTH